MNTGGGGCSARSTPRSAPHLASCLSLAGPGSKEFPAPTTGRWGGFVCFPRTLLSLYSRSGATAGGRHPGHTITVDESMGLWKGKGMLGLMVVKRKPTPVGRESHTTADCDTGTIIFVEPMREN